LRRKFVNCNAADYYYDQTCIPDTVKGSQRLSLYAGPEGTKPIWRRITFDIESDSSTFLLQSFYVSTAPLTGYDFATVIYCGWNIKDQLEPTWCNKIKLSGSAPYLEKVEINRPNLAYIEFFGVYFAGASSVAEPVEYQLDDFAVCVPEDI